MRNIFLAIFLLPCWSFAAETINCHFDKFSQVNHEVPEMTGYAVIDQTLEIVAGKTSEKTLKLDGGKRASNSTNWVLLEPKAWEMYLTVYAGDFGELLTVQNKLGENSNSPNGWYKASLISSNVITTRTYLGNCITK